MKSFLEEYGMMIVYVIIGVFLIGSIAFFSYNNNDLKDKVLVTKDVKESGSTGFAAQDKPILEVRSSRIRKGTEFNAADYIVKAEDSKGNDLSDKVEIFDQEKVDTAVEGEYTVVYVLKDESQLITKAKALFLVD